MEHNEKKSSRNKKTNYIIDHHLILHKVERRYDKKILYYNLLEGEGPLLPPLHLSVMIIKNIINLYISWI